MSDRRDTTHTETYAETKHCLHALAGVVLAGPRFREGGSIELRVRPDGSAPVTRHRFRARCRLGPRNVVVDVEGLTFTDAAALIGLEASRLDDVYSDGPAVDPSETIHLNEHAVREVEQALFLADTALREFHRQAQPTLWPEHFDWQPRSTRSTTGSHGRRLPGPAVRLHRTSSHCVRSPLECSLRRRQAALPVR